MKKLNSGFSMVEVLVTLALLGGLGVVGVQMMKRNVQNEMRLQSTKEMDSLNLQIKATLENPISCKQTLGGLSTSGASFSQVKDEGGLPMFEVGKEYNKLKIDSMAVLGPVPNTGTWIAPSSPGYLQVEITFSRTMTPPETMVSKKKFKLWVRADAASKIENCAGTTFVTNNLWRRSYQNADNIYYQGGRVAIGTASFTTIPSAPAVVPLIIQGQLHAESISGGTIGLGNSPSGNYAITLNGGSLSLHFKDQLTSRNAEMLSRTIYLSRELIVEPYFTPVACTSANVGSIRQEGGYLQWCGRSPLQWKNFVDE